MSTLQMLRNEPVVKNKSSEQLHVQTVLRRVDEWVSPAFLTEPQIEGGLTFHELCIFLFMVKMSRGYEDERVILQVFLMLKNRQDLHGQFGELSHDHEYMEEARISLSDLYILLICTMYHFDQRILDGYVLIDRSAIKPRPIRLRVRKDF
mmetsp:Transcript_38031/g.46477  ORF Transcript_38031/g.46477 Transcript_38031/m.46477 type:complete len:150 (+) Transcript_38031:1302-1751(+)